MTYDRVIVAFDGSPRSEDALALALRPCSRSYGPMQRALLGSVSEALTEGASHAVLVVPRGILAETMEIR